MAGVLKYWFRIVFQAIDKFNIHSTFFLGQKHPSVPSLQNIVACESVLYSSVN